MPCGFGRILTSLRCITTCSGKAAQTLGCKHAKSNWRVAFDKNECHPFAWLLTCYSSGIFTEAIE
jgi:hypothetical protein